MTGRSVTFSFRPLLTADVQEHVLEEIRGWSGVVNAALLKPNAKNPDIARMGYVLLSPESDVAFITEQLGRMSTIEIATAPAERYLMGR